MENKNINNYISSSEFEIYKRRKIGEGRDARVYAAPNGYLYKVYKTFDIKEYDPNAIYDEEGVRIDRSKPISTDISYINYLDENDVRLHSSVAIGKAISRQKDIQLSSLPVAPLYIDGSFKGCVLKRHRLCSEIHGVLPLLSNKKKIQVLKMVLERVNELIKHNIYPIDLANRKGGLEDTGLNHSNILVDLSLTPHLIDLDGKSTRYTEKSNEYYYYLVYSNIATLIIETLLELDTSSEFTELDFDYFRRDLISRGLNPNLTEKIIEGSSVNEEDVVSILDQANSGKLVLKR